MGKRNSKGQFVKLDLTVCRECGVLLTKENYKKSGRRGYICKPCTNEYQCKTRKPLTNKLKKQYREAGLKAKFGMSIEEYDKLFFLQQGKCAICGQPETETRLGVVKRLAVDHNHTTGKIRGLLCCSCNKALGLLKDDISIMKSAIDYLNNDAGEKSTIEYWVWGV